MYLEVYLAIFQFLESSSPLMTDITHKSVTELTTTFFHIKIPDHIWYLLCMVNHPKILYKLPTTDN